MCETVIETECAAKNDDVPVKMDGRRGIKGCRTVGGLARTRERKALLERLIATYQSELVTLDAKLAKSKVLEF